MLGQEEKQLFLDGLSVCETELIRLNKFNAASKRAITASRLAIRGARALNLRNNLREIRETCRESGTVWVLNEFIICALDCTNQNSLNPRNFGFWLQQSSVTEDLKKIGRGLTAASKRT